MVHEIGKYKLIYHRLDYAPRIAEWIPIGCYDVSMSDQQLCTKIHSVINRFPAQGFLQWAGIVPFIRGECGHRLPLLNIYLSDKFNRYLADLPNDNDNDINMNQYYVLNISDL